MDSTVLKTMTAPDEDPKRATEDTERPPREEPAGEEPAATGPERQVLAMQFTSSPRGAQLARRVTVTRLGEWGYPPMSDTSCTVALLVGELAANAVRHCRVRGRDFSLRLTSEARTGVIRVEVSDASRERPPASSPAPSPDAESGRGLFLVHNLATRWGTSARDPIGKTVWAEVAADSETTQR
jgi:anti-sigma regulatory factor (Ser/Thr protein kinase)